MLYKDKKLPPESKRPGLEPKVKPKLDKVKGGSGVDEQVKALSPGGDVDQKLKPGSGPTIGSKRGEKKGPTEKISKSNKPKDEKPQEKPKKDGGKKTSPKDEVKQEKPPELELDKGKEGEDQDVKTVVEKAISMEGTLGHKQNAGGARDALVDENAPEVMNCWDAVIYLCSKAGMLDKQLVVDTAKRSEEDEKNFNETEEMKSTNSKIAQYSDQFQSIDTQLESSRQKVTALNLKADKLRERAGKYFFKTKHGRNKALLEIREQLKSLQQEIEHLERVRKSVNEKKTVLVQKRWAALMETRNRPYKDLLKVDSAWVILTTQQQKGGDPIVTPVKGQWPPPAGCTILFTHDNSSCPDFDHVMLSLGGGKAAHLQSVTPTNLGLAGMDTGKLKVVDLMEYVKLAAQNSDTWTVKAAPPAWR